MKITVLILTIALLSSCSKWNCNCELNPETLAQNDSIFNDIKQMSNWRTFWTEKGESLINSGAFETYRYYYNYSFDSTIKVVYLTEKQLILKTYIKGITNSSYSAGLISEKKLSLSKNEWDKFISLTKDNCFWTMKLNQRSKYILDGAEWSL